MHVSALLYEMQNMPEMVLQYARTLMTCMDNDPDPYTVYGSCTYYSLLYHFCVSVKTWKPSDHRTILIQELQASMDMLATRMRRAQDMEKKSDFKI